MRSLHTILLAASFAVLVFGLRMVPHHEPAAPMAASAPGAHDTARAMRDDASGPQQAAREFARLAATYAHLDGVTVEMGTTPNGEQAAAYYTSGRIVIDRNHRATIEEILAHEIWHVIDWRDNGRLDWGEDVPPATAGEHLLQ